MQGNDGSGNDGSGDDEDGGQIVVVLVIMI